jgi:hypothetical protein
MMAPPHCGNGYCYQLLTFFNVHLLINHGREPYRGAPCKVFTPLRDPRNVLRSYLRRGRTEEDMQREVTRYNTWLDEAEMNPGEANAEFHSPIQIDRVTEQDVADLFELPGPPPGFTKLVGHHPGSATMPPTLPVWIQDLRLSWGY